MAEVPPTQQPGPMVQPHRGVIVLVFGLLGFVCCLVFGVAAWILGNQDLKAMDTGQMDPSGRGVTQAGRIIGIISVPWQILLIIGTASFRAGPGYFGP